MSVVDPVSGETWTPFEGAFGEPFLRFGRAELLAALLAQPTTSAVRTAELLGYGPAEFDDAVRVLGSSALFARGLLASDDGERFVPVREAALLSRAAVTVDVWISVGVAGADAAPAAIGLASADALLLIAREPHGVAAVSLAAGGDRLAETATIMLRDRLDRTTRGGGAFVTVERPTSPDEASVLLARRRHDRADVFDVAIGGAAPDSARRLRGSRTAADLGPLVTRLFERDPDAASHAGPDPRTRGA